MTGDGVLMTSDGVIMTGTLEHVSERHSAFDIEVKAIWQ